MLVLVPKGKKKVCSLKRIIKMKLRSKSIKIIMIFCEKGYNFFLNGPILTVSKYTDLGIYYTKEDLPYHMWPKLVTH